MLGALMYFCIWAFLQPFRWLLANWKVEGLEQLPPRPAGFVLAMNHVHWLDILIIGASMPLRYRPWWIAKVELFDNRLIGWWLRVMQVIPIKRGRRDMSAMVAAETALTEGAVLIIFAEGHRSGTGQLQEGRGGAIRLAVRTGCPIVPAAVYGTERGLAGMLTRKPLRVHIGPAYHPVVEGESIPFNRMNELTEELMLQIAALLPEDRWGFYRERMLQTTMRE